MTTETRPSTSTPALGTTYGPAGMPYPSRRMPVMAMRGIVATSQSLAAQAGLEMLQRGGNAVDAAIATAITLTVVEPTSNGIGSDAFALVWDGTTLHGLNASGRAPAAMTLTDFRSGPSDDQAGGTESNRRGWRTVTVPGAPAAWRDLSARFGRLPFADLFAPAIHHAEHGYPVSPVTAGAWAASARLFADSLAGPEYAAWFATFTRDGAPPLPGDVWRLPHHAATLRAIAESRAESFYTGALAAQITRFAGESGGYLRADDLASHVSEWVQPIHTGYRGYDVWEIPPNGQGITALLGLNILEGFHVIGYPRESAESYHYQIEALKLAYADARAYVADMQHADVPVSGMLNKGYAAERRALITDRALMPAPGTPPRGGTVYLCAADSDGMMVSLIQSNYAGFGSGVVVPGTGIALQNRGAGFSADPAHPNVFAPGKRPYHTIIPSFLTRDGQAVGPFGVMGGDMQPQGHMQMVVNQLDYGMNPQAAIDAPRWRWMGGLDVEIEQHAPNHILHGLAQRGHQPTVAFRTANFGKAQIIRRLANGAYIAGSEPRADGCAVGY